MKVNQLPTIIYQKQIQKLVEPLKTIPNFSSTALCILTRESDTICLSSAPELTVKLQESGFFRGDILFNDKFYQENRVIYPEEYINQDELQRQIKKICESFGIYRAYCITRNCSDCSLIASFNVTTHEKDNKHVYQETIDIFEDFIINFLDNTIDIYVKALPSIQATRFVNDKRYRANVIKLRSDTTQNRSTLTSAEIEVIYWAAQGKTASDIALILELSENTITTYRQRAIKKLNASNLTHAIHTASLIGLIP